MTTDQDRRLLLRLARETIAAHLGRPSADRGARIADLHTALPNPQSAIRDPQCDPRSILAQFCGAFVTLHKHGDLRGCIGHVGTSERLATVVPRCAVAACSADPRFAPISEIELDAIDIEISLLGPLVPITGPAEVVIGRHGLVVEQGWQRGLLLPQVATEWSWDAETFLAQTCHKAGLPRDAWTRGATLWCFDAEVFAEAGSAGRAG